MDSISAVIITHNEERNIERCILSIKDVVDEIIVMDSYSTDSTVAIAEQLGAKVYQQNWLGYSETKNNANAKTSFEYILSLDADEALDAELKESILNSKKAGLKGSYSLNRLTNYCGKWIYHSGWYPDVKTRLFSKNEATWEGAFVHEELVFKGASENTLLKGHLLHYSYYSHKEHRERADRYSVLTAKKFFNQGKRASFLKPMLSGIARFIGMYLIKKGFLDGSAGFHIARISAASNVFKYKELRKLQGENII
ncbi:MAG: glycosyltransferase family 2 protein [Bacteroidetes bacterium]|nr:glycosyltransferase family 2 protein [Bacteroidota bacterium]